METSVVKDMNLADNGHVKIDWVKEHMPVLNSIRAEFEENLPFKGVTVAISLHLEAKTAYLAKVIQAGGADVVITGSNPYSTQDDIAAALVDDGIKVFAKYDPDPDEYKAFTTNVMETEPDLIIDDGGDLVAALHTERPDLGANVRGCCEETTTGVMRNHALEQSGQLKFSTLAVNDANCKHLFDNRYGTGQSVWDNINRTTNLIVAGKTVVVIGYGWCGRGIAEYAKGLNARVVVTEIDSIKAIEAYMDGFEVMSMNEAAQYGDYFVTATGIRDVIHSHHMAVMKDGAILANAGHFGVEINIEDLEASAVSQRIVRDNTKEFVMDDGRKLYLLAEGNIVNLSAGDGHPAEIMDMTFALQALSLAYVNENYQTIGPRSLNVPREIDQRVAELKLKALSIDIDTLSNEQENYIASWEID